MSEVLISAERLSKRYRIRHEETERYTALRDIITRNCKAPFRWILKDKGIDPLKTKSSLEDFWALKEVSFEVKKGEVLGIIGRNGAGKSTLLKILSRITEPTDGRVRLKGKVSSLLEVGTGFHPELTGRENIYLNGAIMGMTKAEITRKFDEIVSFADVSKFLDTPVKRYSSGMYIRLAFAVAAHLEPEILIVDEVLAVGDVEFQNKCIGRITQVAKTGRTILFVSHNMASISNLCTVVAWLDRGVLRAIGPVNAVISDYLSSVSAGVSNVNQGGRPSWATPLINSATLLDIKGQERATFGLGDSIIVQIAFQCNSLKTTIQSPVMGVIIHHATKGTVGGVNTRMTGFTTGPKHHSAGLFRCRLDDLPLIKGSYTIDVWLGDGATDLDTIPGAISFNIEDADIYKSGRVPSSDLGVIYLKPNWEFESQ